MQTVQLVQSRPFSLTKSEDQAAFYALCKILWYLSSGRSHVGFLCDCPENKLVFLLVFVTDDSSVPRIQLLMLMIMKSERTWRKWNEDCGGRGCLLCLLCLLSVLFIRQLYRGFKMDIGR